MGKLKLNKRRALKSDNRVDSLISLFNLNPNSSLTQFYLSQIILGGFDFDKKTS